MLSSDEVRGKAFSRGDLFLLHAGSQFIPITPKKVSVNHQGDILERCPGIFRYCLELNARNMTEHIPVNFSREQILRKETR